MYSIYYLRYSIQYILFKPKKTAQEVHVYTILYLKFKAEPTLEVRKSYKL